MKTQHDIWDVNGQDLIEVHPYKNGIVLETLIASDCPSPTIDLPEKEALRLARTIMKHFGASYLHRSTQNNRHEQE